MNNRNKDKNLEEANAQLKRSEAKKNQLINNIYREYESYLQIVRNSIFLSVEKGIYGLCYEFKKDDKAINSLSVSEFIKKNISLLINSQIPLITVEQLKLSDSIDYPKQIINLNGLNEFFENKEYQNNIDYENQLITEESLQFNTDLSNTYEYYQSLSKEELSSVNLDNNDSLNSFSKPQIIKKTDEEKLLVFSLMELIEESNDNKNKRIENLVPQDSDIFIQNNNLNCFDIIDKSLTNLLLNLSYKINLELFKINLIKKIISEDTFKFLVNKNHIIKHTIK